MSVVRFFGHSIVFSKVQQFVSINKLKGSAGSEVGDANFCCFLSAFPKQKNLHWKTKKFASSKSRERRCFFIFMYFSKAKQSILEKKFKSIVVPQVRVANFWSFSILKRFILENKLKRRWVPWDKSREWRFWVVFMCFAKAKQSAFGD